MVLDLAACALDRLQSFFPSLKIGLVFDRTLNLARSVASIYAQDQKLILLLNVDKGTSLEIFWVSTDVLLFDRLRPEKEPEKKVFVHDRQTFPRQQHIKDILETHNLPGADAPWILFTTAYENHHHPPDFVVWREGEVLKNRSRFFMFLNPSEETKLLQHAVSQHEIVNTPDLSSPDLSGVLTLDIQRIVWATISFENQDHKWEKKVNLVFDHSVSLSPDLFPDVATIGLVLRPFLCDTPCDRFTRFRG